jgi:hypothetical protein
MKDMLNAIHPVRAVSPVATAADNTPVVSQIIDRMMSVGFESLTFLIATGAIPDADATYAVTMHHGDDPALADAALVPADQLVGTLALAGFTFADDDKCFKVGYSGIKRYVRLTITPANNTGVTLICVIALLGHAHANPTANPPSAQL